MTVTQNENKIQGFQTLNIQHVFSSPNVHPFDEIKWERQTAEITDDRGKVIFKQENVEVPSTWSPLAVKIAVSKYFYGEQNTKERETSIKQLIHRVCRTISDWGLEDGYFTQEEAEIFYKELCWLCVNQCGAFNSPVWFNIGIGQQYGIRQLDDKLVYCLNKETNQITKGDPYSHGQASACFIISVKDSIEDIWKAVADSAKLFKYGSGVGADWSSLRSTKETLTGGGKPSGPVSFMRVQDSTGGTIKSGGKTRRSAIMQTLRCWHPDILEFVNAKSNEEKKVWALIEQGYDPSFNGEAYGSVSFQNVNQSVRATDDFMKAATEGKDYDLLSAKDRKPIGKLNAAEVLRKIAEGTHICGDPGLQFEDTIQHWHTLPNTGPINSSNPCCVTGDTLIAVADGRLAVPIKELVGTEVPVYTHDHSRNKTTVRLMWNIGVKRKNVPIYKITLDDGSSFKATDDHPVMIRSGAYQLVKDLKPGTSVMPFHLKVNKLGKNSSKRYCYWTGEKWIPQYIAVWKYFNGQRPVGFHVHHKDFNPLNDLISNFELLTQEAHLEVHRKSMLGDNNPARRLMNDEWRKNLSKSSSGERNGNFGRTYSPEVRLKMKSKARLRWSNPEEHEKHKIRVNKWIAEKRERGEPVGPIKRKPWLTLCCPVCRNTFVTDSDIRIYCSKKCAGKEVGKKVASALKGRPIPQEIKDKLRLKGKARGLSRASELAKIAHKNSILKFARFLFDKGIIPTFESWDLCRKQYLPESGLKKIPMVTTLTQRFESEDDLKEQAQLFNHKVVSVEFYGNEDVYDGTVEETHNFAIFTSSKQSDLSEKHLDYSGLFIHNSEYMSIDDSPCNLASLNLMKFTKTSGEFDVERFKSAVKVFITAQDILVSNAGYPNEAIARNAIDFRQLGLGYSNLGALLMSSGLAYDSDEARNLAGSITALMHLEAYNHSSRLAASIGAFSGFEVNRQPMLKVMKQHLDAALSVKPLKNNAHVWEAARRCGEEAIERGNIFGYRNSQVTVLAPVGTIGFLMSCDTTGIEPDIALIKYKTLAGGGALKIVNNSVRSALKSLGYDPETQEKIMKHLEAHDSVEGCPELKEKDLPVFDCAFKPMNGSRSIHYAGHLRMMSAVQPFLSGAISKTNNMPNSSTVEEIMDAYIMAWKLGLKCVAIYRDGSKRSQPLNTKKGGGEKIDDKLVENASKLALENVSLKKEVEALKLQAVDPLRRRLPDTRQAITHKFSVAGHEGYFTVGLFESGLPGELFIQMAKEGSTIGGLMDTIGTLTSMALQYGVPVEALVRKFVNQQFEPSGFTSNPDIKMAKSIIDYVFRWLERQFVEVERPLIPISPTVSVAGKSNGKHSGGFNEQLRSFQLDAPACSGCGHVMVRNGACYRCLSCGESGGCS